MAVDVVSQDAAEEAARDLVDEIRGRATGKVGRGAAVAIAAKDYLSIARDRPLKRTTIGIVKEIVAQFTTRRLNEISAEEWIAWIDGDPATGTAGRMTGRSTGTRESFLNGVVAFLNFAKKRHGLVAVPEFRRDKKARNPNRRARRRVEDLRPDVIAALLDAAHPAIRGQLAIEVATGARVSSILHGARICDLNLGKGRETITFRKTKTGEDVVAVLNAGAVAEVKRYLKWRGGIHDREAPLFLTPDRKLYAGAAGDRSGQNKTGFNGARRRATQAILDRAEARAAELRRAGKRKAAEDVLAQARADAALLGKVTQHWFRHRLATLWFRKDPRAAMEQGGWLDIKSVMGYSHDSPEFRRQVADEIDVLRPRRSSR